MAGFFLSGLLLSFPGAILPAWGYHVRPHFVAIGNYFFVIVVGLLVSVQLSRVVLPNRGISYVLTLGGVIAFAAVTLLSLTSPPIGEWWRLPGFLALGTGAGLINTGVFHAISGAYRNQPATTVNVSGTVFGLGSLSIVLMIAGVFHVYTVGSLVFLVALCPGLFAVFFAKQRFPSEVLHPERPLSEFLREFTVPSAVLFSALLFFHFGNEWAIANWLPLYLIQRLGISPTGALMLLALYWVALVAGRLTTQAILPLVPHGRLLLASALASIFGCIVLAFTDNVFGAACATLLLGFGFAPIYPLVVEKIGARFPYYHPGFFNGIFSLALTGGMLAPAILGYAAEYFGLRVVIVLPMVGTIIVLALVLLIWLEAKLSGTLSTQADDYRL